MATWTKSQPPEEENNFGLSGGECDISWDSLTSNRCGKPIEVFNSVKDPFA